MNSLHFRASKRFPFSTASDNVAVMTRKRDLNGKFLGDTPPTAQYLRSKRARKERNERNIAIGSRLFNEYLDATFLEGEDRDWIMADAQVGPLASVPIQLFKSAFLPTCNDRCERVRRRYFSYVQDTKQSNIKQEYITDGRNLIGKQKRRRIFKKRRLAKLGCDEEMKRLWNWIDKGLEMKAFKVATRDEAYEVIRKAFNTYKLHNSARYYEEYPPASPDERTQIDGSNGSEREYQTQTAGSASSISLDNAVHATDELLGANVTSEDRASGGALGHVPGGTEEDRFYTSTVCQLLKAAKNDRLFFLLCKVDEDMRECKLDCIAAALLEMYSDGALKCNSMLLDALHYGRLRQSREKDMRAYHVQKHRVRINAELLKLIRRSYTELRPYESMRWTDFPQKPPSKT